MLNILEEIVAAPCGPGKARFPRSARKCPSRTAPWFLSFPHGTVLEMKAKKRCARGERRSSDGSRPERMAKLYAQAGTGISVLTKRNFFNGSLNDLQIAAKGRAGLFHSAGFPFWKKRKVKSYKFGGRRSADRGFERRKLLKMAALARKRLE